MVSDYQKINTTKRVEYISNFVLEEQDSRKVHGLLFKLVD